MRVRKSKKPQLDISFESDVHNIYDPQFSSFQSSFVEGNSEVESSINIESVFNRKSSNSNQNEEDVLHKFSEIHKYNVPEAELIPNAFEDYFVKNDKNKQHQIHNLLRHNSDKLNGFSEQSLEFLIKNEE